MGDPTKLTRAIMAKPPRPFNLRFSNHSNVERHCWASALGQKLTFVQAIRMSTLCQKQTEAFRDLNRWRFDHSLSLFVP